MAKTKYYSLKNILEYDADYNIIYGERSNGKTTAVLSYAMQNYINSGYRNQLAIIRREDEDLKGKKGDEIFSSIVNLDWISAWTKGKYNSVHHNARRWYLCFIDDDGERVSIDDKPFALGFTIASEEHYKMTSYPTITTILFDEFLTRRYYLPEEFVKFQNLLSTIIRLRDDVKIFMCGNTINKFCPYFSEMGLLNVKTQKIGTIDIYTYANSPLKIAVEYSDFPSKHKPSNKYFAFNNPKLEMIKNGGWEIDIYPHLPKKYLPKDIIDTFYISFDGELLECDFVVIPESNFIYIHRKTSPIKADNERLVYQQKPDYRLNYRNNLFKPISRFDKLIRDMFINKKIFYQDNEIGEIVNNFIKWCKTNI